MNATEDAVIDFTKKRKEDNKDEIQYLTFRIGQENYALKLVENKEVIEPPPITRVPNTETYVMGVINLRGQIVPVINLQKKLGVFYEKAKGEKIIIVEIDDSLVGILVADVEDVVGINQNNIEEITESKGGINQEFINGVFSYEEDLVIIINIREILLGNEEKEEEKDAQ